MYSYYFRAVENYKDAFKLMRVIKIEYFNNYFYFYYIDNGIDPLTVIVDLNRLPPVVIEGKSYIELSKEL